MLSSRASGCLIMSSIVEQRQQEDMTNMQTPWNMLFGVDEALHRGIGNVN